MTPKRRTNGASRRRRRRGWTLVECLFYLAVFSIFLGVTAGLMVASSRAPFEARRRMDSATGFDLALAQLRRDVWSAERLSADARSATLREPDGSVVHWTLEPDAGRVDLRRAVTPAGAGRAPLPATWVGLPRGLAFAAEGGVLRLHTPIGVDKDPAADEILLPNELTATGATP